jgi:hypothetical protein
MFWNVRGIGQDIKKNFIRDTIQEKQLDFVGLKETIKSNFTKNELHNLSGGKFFFGNGLLPEESLEGFLWGLIMIPLT